MSKPDQVFIWHGRFEFETDYAGFKDAYVGDRTVSVRLHPYEPDAVNTESDTAADIIPNQIARSSAVVLLLSGSEEREPKIFDEFTRLLQGVANAPHRIIFTAVFLRKAGKDWWTDKIEPRIVGLTEQQVESIEAWSSQDPEKPSEFSGRERDNSVTRRIEDLRKKIEAKIRFFADLPPPAFPGWGSLEGSVVILLLPKESESSVDADSLVGALGELPYIDHAAPIIPIIWDTGWQEPSSQKQWRYLFKPHPQPNGGNGLKPALFIRIIADAGGQISEFDGGFRQDVQRAIGLGDIEFGPEWVQISKSIWFDWAPHAVRPQDGSGSPIRAGMIPRDVALEIGRVLKKVMRAPPRVSYMAIERGDGRGKSVPDPQTFEQNLRENIREALAEVLMGYCAPPQPGLWAYNGKFDQMIKKEIKKETIPILLADDLAASAQLDIEEIAMMWENVIKNIATELSKNKTIFRAALIYSGYEDYNGIDRFSRSELYPWFPLAVDKEGNITNKAQIDNLTNAVKKVYQGS
jgi:hypothetical protein